MKIDRTGSSTDSAPGMIVHRNGLLFCILAMATLPFAAAAADWNQFRGPDHDGSSPEKILMKWPASGLHENWKAPLTDGFSAMSLGDGEVFTLVTREIEGADQEACVALDEKTGHELWSVPVGIAEYDNGGNKGTSDNSGGDGPRSTPAYDGGKVYAYSSRMVLECLDAKTGKRLWSHNMMREFSGRNIHWESAASPLIEGGFVFVACGGAGQSLVAFDKKTGAVVWKGESDAITQSTPVATTILGQRQILFYTQRGLVAVVPQTGKVLWRFPFRYSTSTAISPVVSGDLVFCSAAYGIGSAVCRVSKTASGFAATQLWYQPSSVLQSHWSTPVCANGFLYGLFGQARFGSAPLKCVEMATGRIWWSHEGFGPGGCTLVNGHVLVLSDAGDLVLVKATPKAYVEDARSHILSGKCWNYAAISDGRIYARSTREGVSLDVSPK